MRLTSSQNSLQVLYLLIVWLMFKSPAWSQTKPSTCLLICLYMLMHQPQRHRCGQGTRTRNDMGDQWWEQDTTWMRNDEPTHYDLLTVPNYLAFSWIHLTTVFQWQAQLLVPSQALPRPLWSRRVPVRLCLRLESVSCLNFEGERVARGLRIRG